MQPLIGSETHDGATCGIPVADGAVLLTGCGSGHRPAPANGGHRPLPAPTVALSRPLVPAAVRADAVVPAVTGAVGHQATITIPKAGPSGRFVVAGLATRRGRRVARGDAVVAGWDKALVGARVGNRVLLVVPSGLGCGAQARKGIPAGSTLVYVVDILGLA